MISLVFIGAGRVANVHYDALVGCRQRARLLAVCDPSKEARQDRAEVWGVPAYETISGMLAAHRPDAAVVMVPPRIVPAVMRELLGRIPFVLLEKPVGVDEEAALEVQALESQHGAKVLLGHNGLHHAGFAAIQEALARGTIGTVTSISAESSGWLHFRTGDFRQDAILTGGGVWMDTGSHLVYTLRELFGTPTVCHAMMGNLARPEMEGEDHALLHWRFPGGQIASVETSYGRKRPGWKLDWPKGFFLQFTLWGTSGSMRYSLCPEVKTEMTTGGAWEELAPSVPFLSSFERQMEHFLDVIAGKVEPCARVGDGVAVLAVLRQAYAMTQP